MEHASIAAEEKRQLCAMRNLRRVEKANVEMPEIVSECLGIYRTPKMTDDKLYAPNPRWPDKHQVVIGSIWKVKDRPFLEIKSGSTAILTGADMMTNTVKLTINPAIGWEGTAQELADDWEPVPDETKLTF